MPKPSASRLRTVGELATMDVTDPRMETDLLGYLAEHRARDWAFRSERGIEVLRHDQIRDTLIDRRLGTGMDGIASACGLDGTWFADQLRDSMHNATGPRHTRLRGAIAGYFTPAQAENWRPMIREITETLLGDSKPGDKIDLVERLCVPLPGIVFCRLIGAPDEDADFLTRTSDAILKMFRQDPSYRAEILGAAEDLRAYVLEKLSERRARPGEDLLSAMLAYGESGGLTEDELVNSTMELLEASTDNTTMQLATALIDLIEAPGQWDAIAREPERIGAAVTEAIRYTPRVGVIDRIALSDTVIDGLEVEAGTWLRCSVISGQRDESAFASPDTFDLARTDQRRPLVFGAGRNYCVGAFLAQMEIEEVLRQLTARFPLPVWAAPPVWSRHERATVVESLLVCDH
ncbi:hypothetical protein GCM10027589_15410 [Actinocorallia lasiicapitis]